MVPVGCHQACPHPSHQSTWDRWLRPGLEEGPPRCLGVSVLAAWWTRPRCRRELTSHPAPGGAHACVPASARRPPGLRSAPAEGACRRAGPWRCLRSGPFQTVSVGRRCLWKLPVPGLPHQRSLCPAPALPPAAICTCSRSQDEKAAGSWLRGPAEHGLRRPCAESLGEPRGQRLHRRGTPLPGTPLLC